MEDLIKELEQLNKTEFIIEMADHLDSNDYRFLHELREKKSAIEQELKEKYNCKEEE